ncbi:MAG: TlyA family RNA methyltransferase [Candidatus Eremiobacteraeota bacterium]|nr:TlyA family RNA methyltransferase [Candidatus Eremiobacteraeota bacterium]
MQCKLRLDAAVAAQGEVSRSRARSLIIAGRVRVNGNPVTKPGSSVGPDAVVDVVRARPYVSRGGEKLEHALDCFKIDASGVQALDIGASTGGFTDCLLSHGAEHVTAVDVGYGQLAWQLRNDPRVTVLERCNFRTLSDDAFPAGFELIVIDTSFISLLTILARARQFLRPNGTIIALVKPQFEAGKERLGRGGVVRDPRTHRAVLREVRDGASKLGLFAQKLAASPLRGPAGNREFLILLCRHGTLIDDSWIDLILADP